MVSIGSPCSRFLLAPLHNLRFRFGSLPLIALCLLALALILVPSIGRVAQLHQPRRRRPVDGSQIELFDHIGDESRQVAFGQPIVQGRRRQQPLVQMIGPESLALCPI